MACWRGGGRDGGEALPATALPPSVGGGAGRGPP